MSRAPLKLHSLSTKYFLDNRYFMYKADIKFNLPILP